MDQAIALEAYRPNCKKHGWPVCINHKMARLLYCIPGHYVEVLLARLLPTYCNGHSLHCHLAHP